MEMYFLKSAACLAILLLFYKLLLERENMHGFKRFYLLISAVAAIVIPLITFTSYVEPSSELFNRILISSEVASEEVSTSYLPYILIGIYVLGVLFFSIKFIRNLRNLILKIQKNPKIKHHNIINVLLSEKTQPHTFFSFIFFNKQKYLNNEIPKDVKIHEEAHASQKHSLDVIFIELLQIVFWINPLIYLLKKAIKLNHEFLADRAVIQQGINTAHYQQTLLSFSSRDLQSDLVNPINYSSIKKRFTVMKTQTSKNAILVRSFLLVPLLAGLFFSFSSREFVEKDILQQIAEKDVQINPDKVVLDSVKFSEVIVIKILQNGNLVFNQKPTHLSSLSSDIISRQNSLASGKKISRAYIETFSETPMSIITDVKEIIKKSGVSEIYLSIEGETVSKVEGIKTYKKLGNTAQEKATPKMIAEYNKLVRYYNAMPKDKLNVKQEDAIKIMAILGRMTSKQKEKAEKINFNFPPPPPPSPAPAPEMNPDNVPPPPPPAPQVSSSEVQDQMPPPPPPSSYEDLVEKGAIFYYNGKEIKPEEARILVEVEKKVNVQILNYDGKPEVRLTDKEK
jgi:biopolymer transport protein ExbD